MCLIRDNSIRITGDRVWKILKIKGSLCSLLFEYAWNPGWNMAMLQWESPYDDLVSFGFHAYINKSDAVNYCKILSIRYPAIKFVVAEFTFNTADLIATGVHEHNKTEEAVFKRLHLAQEEYQRVLST